MNIKVKYRFPEESDITLVLDSKEYILTNMEYVNIIRPCSRIGDTGKDYLTCREKHLLQYIDSINNPPIEDKSNSMFKW